MIPPRPDLGDTCLLIMGLSFGDEDGVTMIGTGDAHLLDRERPFARNLPHLESFEHELQEDQTVRVHADSWVQGLILLFDAFSPTDGVARREALPQDRRLDGGQPGPTQ